MFKCVSKIFVFLFGQNTVTSVCADDRALESYRYETRPNPSAVTFLITKNTKRVLQSKDGYYFFNS